MLAFKSSRKKCKNKCCGKIFDTTKKKHVYCCRECYLSDYKKNNEEDSGLPTFRCPDCGMTIKMEYSPLINPLKWFQFKCTCGYQNYENDYQEVQEIKNRWKEMNKLEKVPI